MAYTRVNWQNNISTPINADKLNIMDAGIDDHDTKINDNMKVYQNLIWVVNNPTKVSINDVFQTLGFYAKDDGGMGRYKTIATTGSETWTQVASVFYLDGSGNIKLDGTKKLKLVTIDIVNVAQMGAIGTSFDATYNIDTAVDDTISIKNAIIIAKSIKGVLVFQPYKYYTFSDTLTIDQPITLNGNNCVLMGNIKDKTKPVILTSNQRERQWSDLEIRGNAWLPLAGIQFTTPDSQAMRVRNIRISTCRYGFLVMHEECINRIIFDNCRAENNLFAGIWVQSLKDDGITYGISAPVFFKDCIFNGNGVTDSLKTLAPYAIPVWVSGTDSPYGYQVYLQGLANVSFIGGQISNHLGAYNLALAMFNGISGVYSYGMDVEDIHTPVDLNGNLITDWNLTYNDSEGSALLFKDCYNVTWLATYTWKIQTQSVFKFQNAGSNFDSSYVVKGIWSDMNNVNSNSKYDVFLTSSVGTLIKLDTDQTRLNSIAANQLTINYIYRKLAPFGNDFHSYTQPGTYYLDGSSATLTNYPNGTASRWKLKVEVATDGTIYHEATSRTNSDYVFYETCFSSTWTEWRQILGIRPNGDIASTIGNLTIKNNVVLAARNAANSANVNIATVTATDQVSIGQSGNSLGFYGSGGTTKQTLAANATDLTTALTLVNDIKTKLQSLGLMN